MSNLNRIVSIEKNWGSQNFNFQIEKILLSVNFWWAPAHGGIEF